MTKPPSLFNLTFSYYPWVYFFIFLTANTLLSYFSLSYQAQLWVSLLGLALPLLVAWFSCHPQSDFGTSLSKREFLPPVPLWIWLVMTALLIFVRFYKLTTLSIWPLYDDSLWGWMALKFFETPGWPLFYGHANFPSTYLWGLGLLFKFFHPSLFTLWCYPAFLSLFTVGMGYWAALHFFSKSISFLIAILLAFGFWPLYIGRICDQMSLVLFWECGFLGLLGLFLESRSRAPQWALGLGAAAGSGFYIFISCAPLAVLGGLAVLYRSLQQKSRAFSPFFLYLAGFLLLLLPLWKSGLKDSIASYSVSGFWTVAQSGFSRQLSISLSYLSVLFWGMEPSAYTYQPVWGGFLDPLLSSFFALGLLELFRRGGPRALWMGAAFVLLLLPGMITSSREPLRVLPVLPVLLVVCALGWERLLRSLPPNRTLPALVVFALAFAGLDFYHLAVKYGGLWDSPQAWSGYSKSIERYRAHFLLDQTAASRGTGLIFTDFLPGLCDQSLTLLDYPYNAAQNPRLLFQDTSWAAVLANVNYKSFLSRRFPQGKAYALSQGLSRPDGGWMLWVMPLTPSIRVGLQKWRQASESFECSPQQDAWVLLPRLLKAYPFFQGDPFLESCFWEKVSDFSFRVSGFKDFQLPLECLEKAVTRGYPAANLYWRMGSFATMSGQTREARRDYEKALQAPLGLTNAASNLESLKAISKPLYR